ncbi:MAG: ROK family protein [Clostridiales bacterium]|nr:ROK family protein [Clostridiales bacterium]
MKKYVGIDIGGTAVKGILVSEDGTILQKSSIPTLATRPFEEVAASIGEQIVSLTGGERIEGVGVGCPGMVDGAHGVIVYNNNLYWKDAPLADALRQKAGVPVKVANDANAACLGECRFGAGQAYSDAALITLGTGVGGGIVIGGKLFEGCNGRGAEIGHMTIVADGVPCTCGRKGCFETYASATALVRQTVFAMLTDRKSAMWDYAQGDLNKVDGKTSFECAKAGDGTAQRVIDAYLHYLAEGIINVVNIFGSQAVILGGGVCAQGAALTDPLKKYVNANRYGGDRGEPTAVVTAKLGNDAGCLGAASLVMA